MNKFDKSLLRDIVSRHSPSEIQGELAKVYEEYANISRTEAEIEFWSKCARASKNLSSGMLKWMHAMMDELETGEPDETEGG
jgi:hypothetical protein